MIMFYVLIIAGLFTTICAAANWDWYFKYSVKIQRLIKMFGRDTTRVLLIIFGILIIGAAVYLYPFFQSLQTQ